MRSMKKRQRKILMKRLECDSKSRQIGLSMSLLYFKGKSYVQEYPLHTVGILALSMIATSKSKNIRTLFYGYKHARQLVHSLEQ